MHNVQFPHCYLYIYHVFELSPIKLFRNPNKKSVSENSTKLSISAMKYSHFQVKKIGFCDSFSFANLY